MDRKEMIGFYEGYYDDKDISEWRTLGGVDKFRNIKQLLTKRRNLKSILEVGCGDGAILQLLAEYNFSPRLYGVEISKTAIECLRRRNIKNLINIFYFDGYHLPFPDISFDLVLLSHVIEHVSEPLVLLKEVKRVGRCFLFQVPLEDNALANKARQRPENYAEKIGHINFFNRDSFLRFVSKAGFLIIEEIVTDSSLNVYLFRKKQIWQKMTAVSKFLIKRALLKLFRQFALRMLTYNLGVFCIKERN